MPVLAAALWLLHPVAAAAWESDVHSGLTRWLALQAGATVSAAEQLASEDQGLDDGVHAAIHSVFHYACLHHEDDVSRDVRDDHFPSYAAIPGPPASRAVTAASPASRRRVEDRLRNPGPDPRYEAELFGRALHSLQDSWSHEGVPDIPSWGPFLCSSDLAWGHPAARHGWSKHDADMTSLWPKATTVDMARTTYEYILAFLRKYPSLREREPKAWKDLASELDGFHSAATKSDKKRWFETHGIKNTSFLDGTSLDDGDETFAVRKPVRSGLPPTKYAAGAPREVVSFYTGFFKDWAFTYNFAALAANYVDTPSLARALAATHRDVEASPQLVVQTLRLWRMRDHGKVAALDHTIPSNATATAAMAALSDDFQLAQYTSVSDAFISLTGDPELPYVVETLNAERRTYVALARFANAPYDTLAVIAATIEGRLKVVDLLSVVDH